VAALRGRFAGLVRAADRLRVRLTPASSFVPDRSRLRSERNELARTSWAILKRRIIGIRHWASPKHLSRYAAESTMMTIPADHAGSYSSV
jgi:hypothetical protein